MDRIGKITPTPFILDITLVMTIINMFSSPNVAKSIYAHFIHIFGTFKQEYYRSLRYDIGVACDQEIV